MNVRKRSVASPTRLRVAIAALLFGEVLLAGAYSQLDASMSDPVELGIVQGFPPPGDKLVTKANSMHFPNLAWALRNTRMMMPTANVEHARARLPLPLLIGPALDPDKVQFPVDGTTLNLAEYMRRTYTDGFIGLHNGKILYEGYFNSHTPHHAHAWASMTKSVTGLISAQLVDEGKLNPSAKLSTYVPDLASCHYVC